MGVPELPMPMDTPMLVMVPSTARGRLRLSLRLTLLSCMEDLLPTPMLVMLHMVPTLLSMVLVLLRPTMSSDTLSPTLDTELLSTPLMLESAPTILVSRCLAREWTESDDPTSQPSLGTSESLVNIRQYQLGYLVIWLQGNLF